MHLKYNFKILCNISKNFTSRVLWLPEPAKSATYGEVFQKNELHSPSHPAKILIQPARGYAGIRVELAPQRGWRWGPFLCNSKATHNLIPDSTPGVLDFCIPNAQCSLMAHRRYRMNVCWMNECPALWPTLCGQHHVHCAGLICHQTR